MFVGLLFCFTLVKFEIEIEIDIRYVGVSMIEDDDVLSGLVFVYHVNAKGDLRLFI